MLSDLEGREAGLCPVNGRPVHEHIFVAVVFLHVWPNESVAPGQIPRYYRARLHGARVREVGGFLHVTSGGLAIRWQGGTDVALPAYCRNRLRNPSRAGGRFLAECEGHRLPEEQYGVIGERVELVGREGAPVQTRALRRVHVSYHPRSPALVVGNGAVLPGDNGVGDGEVCALLTAYGVHPRRVRELQAHAHATRALLHKCSPRRLLGHRPASGVRTFRTLVRWGSPVGVVRSWWPEQEAGGVTLAILEVTSLGNVCLGRGRRGMFRLPMDHRVRQFQCRGPTRELGAPHISTSAPYAATRAVAMTFVDF